MDIQNSYDLLPYHSKSFSSTTPLRIAACLKLLGFDAPCVKKARILELGCSYGGNIIPIAIYFPDCEIVGVDLSEIQVNEGNKVIEKIGLKNIKLVHKNILDIDESFGKFDYIICHGVYSWVPDNVKEGILKIISNNLTENGAALVSYNCYPGWKKYDILKDVMKFRISSLKDLGYETDEATKIKIALGALEFLEEHSLLSDELKEFSKKLSDKNSYYVYHEYLEENNDPIYIYDFAKELDKFSLMHVIDTSLTKSPMTLDSVQSNMISKESEGNHIIEEQYLDYIRDTQFRKSIIINKKNKGNIIIGSSVLKENLLKMYVRGSYKFEEDKIYFESSLLEEPVNIELLKYITLQYPLSISVQELVDKFGNEAYDDVFLLILLAKIEFYSYNLDIKKEGNIKLKETVLNYIRYFLGNKEPVITFSNFSNDVANYSEEVLGLFTIFDGTKNQEDILNEIIESLDDENKKDEELIKNLRKMVESIKETIISDMMNE